MSGAEFLLWARGPAIQFAAFIFVAGVAIRIAEILILGRKKNLAELRDSGIKGGFKTILRRSVPADKTTFQRSMFTYTVGYVFHIGLLVAIFLLAPHIEVFKQVLGFGWPALPTPFVDFLTVLSLIAMMAILWRRITHPLINFLTTPGDYVAWGLTFVPLLTGYLAYHHLLLPYEWMLGLHIFSVALLMVAFPFTKLMHTFTLFIARYYNGAMAGEKGVQQ